MIKKLSAICISLVLMLSMTQAAFASELGIKIVGQKESLVHTPIVNEGIAIFPFGEILNFLDNSGTETINTPDNAPAYSYVTFQGECFKITQGSTEVQEYDMDETGTCFNATGDVHQLETPARYLDDYRLGIFVPLNFISDILANSKYGTKFDTLYIEDDNNLEFTLYNVDDSEYKQPISPITLAMKVNSPWLLTTDNGSLFDDNDHSVTPVTRLGTTLLPIAPIISKLGGQTKWDSLAQKVTITLNSDTIELWIGKKTALVNGVKKELTLAPTSISGRTMIPVRFVTENLGAKVSWYKDSQMVFIFYGDVVENDLDLFSFAYKIAILDAVQKQEDNK